MACGMRVFRAERRAEGINLRQCQTIGFDIQLAGHGKENFLTKKIFREINLTFVGAWQIHHVQGGDAEHLAGTFGIGRRDDGRIDPVETLFVEKAVYGLRHAITQTSDCAKQICTWAQMRNFT